MLQNQIQFEKLNVEIETNKIISKLDLSVNKGELLSIIGPNGAGKSTLLKTLYREIPFTKGKILLENKLIEKYSNRQLAQNIAVLNQDTQINHAYTAQQIVMMGRYPHLKILANETVHDEAIVKDVMVRTYTWQLREQYIQTLSGGERQRLLLARALAQQPRVLLLDEPTANLDINYQLEILDLIRELTRQKITCICVLHDLNSAANYSDRIAVLHKQKIIAVGKPYEVLTKKMLEEVYCVKAIINKHPIYNTPHIITFSKQHIY